MSEGNPDAEALVPRFKFEELLNQDQAGRRSSLRGTIDGQPALLILERAPFPTSPDYLASIPATLQAIKNLGANDIYHWYLAHSGTTTSNNNNAATADHSLADLKINLIYPCTDKHIKKYSKQGLRFVTETPEIYLSHVRPYMERQRAAGRLNWVYNILSGEKEAEDVIYRTSPPGAPPLNDSSQDEDENFLLLPDLNWDRRTIPALHLLGLVSRRDLWSLRDLRRRHLPWLRHMRDKFLDATTQVYPDIDRDQIKLYLHYQPTYYHLHVHVVHVALEAGATQAVGKAVGLEAVIAQLEGMGGREEGEEAGMDSVTMCYTLGEESELWREVFGPLKQTTSTDARSR
ncbi:HIT-like domain-containing protein [Staphylotrichum tortipilum]|uniref:HIT-like domain-containing protein n=1 Tax=Staphylotrichum tortipilum TaxID=2831512 RepID=A0AAN6RRR7_9PEZI|nr:HIT-like domain-containing protein [Staphylotrichum longicolle]